MRVRRVKFKIALPLVYLVLALLPVAGMIFTIAEGPNPFGFLVDVSSPGFYLLDLLDPILPGTDINFWLLLLGGLLVNCAIYFLVGYVIDYTINRLRSARQREHS